MAPEKHTTYYNLRDAFERDGCALCGILEKNTIKYFDDLLYEGVNNREINAGLLKSNAYCFRHAQILLDFKDAMVIAMLYQRVIEQLKNRISKKTANEFIRDCGDFEQIQIKNCPACANEKNVIDRYLDAFVDFVDDFLRMIKGKQTFSFCAGHFIIVLGRLAADNPLKAREFKDIQRDNLEKLFGLLDKLIDSYDYQYAGKLSDREKTAWIDAVNIISGRAFNKQKKWK